MNDNKLILLDILWSFASFDKIETQSEFEKILADYEKEITGRRMATEHLRKVVVESNEMVVIYSKWNESIEDHDDLSVKLTADNGKTFNSFEILHKIHNAVYKDLEDDEKCYFEGLMYGSNNNPEYDGIPLYYMIQGS